MHGVSAFAGNSRALFRVRMHNEDVQWRESTGSAVNMIRLQLQNAAKRLSARRRIIDNWDVFRHPDPPPRLPPAPVPC